MVSTDASAESRHGNVAIRTASTPTEARILASVLEGAGIPTYVDSGLLVDEFAISQLLMNQLGVRVRVPAALAREAEAVLAEEKPTDAELTAQALAAVDDGTALHAADGPLSRVSVPRRALLLLLVMFGPLLCWVLVLLFRRR